MRVPLLRLSLVCLTLSCGRPLADPCIDVSCAAVAHGTNTCVGGTCELSCERPFLEADGACVPPDTAEACGQQLRACPTDPNGTSSCEDGACVLSCDEGHSLATGGDACVEIDACAIANGGCDQTCTRTSGGRRCSCDSGYELQSDGTGCSDVDECAADTDGCPNGCENTPGSFRCTCDPGYLRIPAATLPDGTGVPSFCVMKYEASAGDSGVVSVAGGTPLAHRTWTQAREACAAAGKRLIGENEWLVLAHDASHQSANWTGGTVGAGSLFTGHSDRAPLGPVASGDDGDGYLRTGDSSPSPQRRTLLLSSGDTIWDLSGNVMEWVDMTIPIAERYHGGAAGWLPYPPESGGGAVNVPLAKRPQNHWTTTHGTGLYSDGSSLLGAWNGESTPPDACWGNCAPIAAFSRGGGYSHDTNRAGLFMLDLNAGRSFSEAWTGFRCTGP